MPTKRRTFDRMARPDLPDSMLEYFMTGDLPEDDAGAAFFFSQPSREKDSAPAEWCRVREALLEAWRAEYPGTRPAAWWSWDAPERSRARLGGIGTPKHECLAIAPWYRFGVPSGWLSHCEELYYTGRLADVEGNRLHSEGEFSGVAIDPRNPPRFESQAAFLERHGLLDRVEKRRVKRADFERETVILPSEHLWDQHHPYRSEELTEQWTRKGFDVVIADPMDQVTDYAFRVVLSA